LHVGIRELHDGLSKYLREVRAGKTITITNRGTPIARLVPIAQPNDSEHLEIEGRVRPPKRRKRPAPIPLPADGIISDLLTNDTVHPPPAE
jgi:prevent-host-death family protein